MNSDFTNEQATRYVANAEFTQAAVFFKDGSHLTFEHTSRENRWARPSADDTIAGTVCRSMTHFRLNAKHLQLFFEDGSNSEFGGPTPLPGERTPRQPPG